MANIIEYKRTTAGYKSTFSYQKLIQLLCQSVAQPDKAIILGGSWRVPVKEGLLARNFLEDIKNDGTYNEDAFQREYKLLYSLNAKNCWKTLKQLKLQRNFEIK